MVWVIPTDAFLVAFFVCLGQTKRAVDVRRGVLPHVPPDALVRAFRARVKNDEVRCEPLVIGDDDGVDALLMFR